MGRKAAAKKCVDGLTEQITGTVDRLFVAMPGFSAGKVIEDETGKVCSFVVKQQVTEGSRLTLHGEWTTHAKYGEQFQAERVEYRTELDVNGLALWLEKNKELKGIGRSRAKALAAAFGTNFDEALRDAPHTVQDIGRLTNEQMEGLITTWNTYRKDAALITWLASFELSLNEIDKIKERFGDEAYGILQADPYLLIREIDRFGFRKVDKIALRMGTKKDDPKRVKHGVLWVLREAVEEGDTYVSHDDLMRKAELLLELDRADAADLIRDMVAQCVNDYSLHHWPEQNLYVDAQMRTMEQLIFWRLRDYGKVDNPHFELADDDDYCETTIKSISPQLNDDQNSAAYAAMRRRISLISGGAGTGKTYTVNTIRLLYEYLDKSVALCAPTGKAARRLEETTGHAAHTIHRLLDYRPGLGWGYHGLKQLPYDCVIVDETSMVDSILAYRLFDAIDFKRTALILVGDHHQLPPVGPGNLLRDLMNSDIVSKTILTDVVRQAGRLKANCTAILSGHLAPSEPENERGFTPWQVIKGLDDASHCASYVTTAFRQILEGWPNVDLVSDIQLLTPQKMRDIGTRALNMAIQRIVQKMRHGVDVEPLASDKARPKIYQYDKVIQTKNDYDLDVMNGTLGRVLHIDETDDLVVQFEGKEQSVTLPKEKQSHLELAYALTIHKSQGSEFPMVLLIVHKSHSFMHNRGLLYTGATRAKRKLIILGDTWGIRNCLATEIVDKRKTYLSKLLQGGTN